MTNIIPFKKKQASRKGKTLCASNHHKWSIDKNRQFDVRTGKLITRYVCDRCGKVKVKSH